MQQEELKKTIYNATKAASTADPYDFAMQAIRPLALESMKKAVLVCKDCKMNKDGKCRKSLYSGHPDANILIITDYHAGDGDGPLSKKEMDMLNQAYDVFGADVSQIAYMNAVSCEPRSDTGIVRPPTTEEVCNCKVFTDYAIKVLQPGLILLMGNFALNTYAHNVNIKSKRGQWMEINGIPAMPTYSPSQISALVQMDECNDLQEEMKNAFADDLYQAFRWFQERYPETNFAPSLLVDE